jgi:hypothetical protein
LALPVLLHGSETWTGKSKDKSRLTAAEMRFMRKTAKYTRRDHKINEEILNEIKVTSILDKITSYKRDWIQHTHQMPRSEITKFIYIKRHKKSGQTTEETPGRMRPEQASNGLFP